MRIVCSLSRTSKYHPKSLEDSELYNSRVDTSYIVVDAVIAALHTSPRFALISNLHSFKP